MASQMKCFVLLIIVLMLAGCGAKRNTRYAWCDYDSTLYEYYKAPAQKDEFVKTLKETIDEAESENSVPPGIYAEYGFAMYEQGKIEQAVLYYQKESNKWPESKYLMAKMIATAQKRSSKSDVGSVPAAIQQDDPAGDAVSPSPPAPDPSPKTTQTPNQGVPGVVEVLK
ncbi:MAG: DUF4810 domain-containing protein [Geobacteraceae bacterium]